MDWGSLFKFVHVSAAIVWIGAGVGLIVLGIAARRATDRDGYIRVIQQVIFLAPRLFVPSSIAAFVSGALTAYFNGWDLTTPSNLWLWLGLIGFAATFVTGNFFIRPRAERVEKIIAAEGVGSDRGYAVSNEVLLIAQFDYLMLFLVVADMVMKPSAADWPLLLAFAIVLIGGVAYFLAPVLRKPAVAPIGATG